ncbi:MAG: tetratricopeptide repeat protein, partial [Bacteroidota bacterium]
GAGHERGVAAGERAEDRRGFTRHAADPTALATTFAIGEEQGLQTGSGGVTREATPVLGALASGDAALVPGTTTRLDLVVRTRGLGHFFPTGTVDAQEAWVELRVTDAAGRTLRLSGAVDDSGTVDPSAHFYRNLMVDGHGNPIDKRNAFAARATVYVNLIPPGAADVVHYRLAVPDDVVPPVTVAAALHYRKFTYAYTRFAYGGLMQAGDFGVDYDDRSWTDGPVPDDVPGLVKTVPDVPIVTMAVDTLRLAVADRAGLRAADPLPGDSTATAMRWNDYGIGLLREGDLKSAARAFAAVTRLHPTYADGWINRARVALQDSDLDAADGYLAEALRLNPGFLKARYFRALIHKDRGDYPDALADLRAVAEAFPSDRVVLGTLGRVFLLSEQFSASVGAFEDVLAIDPEDVMAHYNLMLAFQALGDRDRALAHRLRYERYKADESAVALTRLARQRDPHANREALPIHLH